MEEVQMQKASKVPLILSIVALAVIVIIGLGTLFVVYNATSSLQGQVLSIKNDLQDDMQTMGEFVDDVDDRLQLIEEKLNESSESAVSTTDNSTGDSFDEELAIRTAVHNVMNADYGSYEVVVSKFNSKYATGGIKPKVDAGGAFFLAAKDSNGTWEIIHRGQTTVSCSTLEKYPDFPKDYASECLDASGKSIKR